MGFPLWIIGAGINLVGSVSINLGTNLMKLGHNQRALIDLPEAEKPKISKFKAWLFGMVIFVVGNLLNFASFSFAAQSLLAALGSVQFIANVVFASTVNKEKITLMILLATGLIVGGCVVLVAFGNHSSETYTVQQLISYYKQPAYVVYLTMMGVFFFGAYILYLHGKAMCRLKKKTDGKKNAWHGLVPVAYATFSALLGTQSVLFSKSLSVLLRSTFKGDNQLGYWYTWVSLLCFILTSMFYITRLNKGIRMFPAMIIVPMLQICWTLFSIISGMIYFQEYKSFSVLSAVMFPIGVIIVLLGVYLLQRAGAHQAELDEALAEAACKEAALHDNACFESRPAPVGDEHDPDIPARRITLDSLRFTSLASATTNIKTMKANSIRRMEVVRRQSEADQNNRNLNGSLMHHGFNSTMSDTHRMSDTGSSVYRTSHGGGGEMGAPGLATGGGAGSPPAANRPSSYRDPMADSKMSTFKRRVQAMHHRLKADFGLGDKNTAKTFLGLGEGQMPAISLFAMPALDYTMTGGRPSQAGAVLSSASSAAQLNLPPPRLSAGGLHSETAMTNALPHSRFFGPGPGQVKDLNGRAAHGFGLDPITEGDGLGTALPSHNSFATTAPVNHLLQGLDDMAQQRQLQHALSPLSRDQARSMSPLGGSQHDEEGGGVEEVDSHSVGGHSHSSVTGRRSPMGHSRASSSVLDRDNGRRSPDPMSQVGGRLVGTGGTGGSGRHNHSNSMGSGSSIVGGGIGSGSLNKQMGAMQQLARSESPRRMPSGLAGNSNGSRPASRGAPGGPTLGDQYGRSGSSVHNGARVGGSQSDLQQFQHQLQQIQQSGRLSPHLSQQLRAELLAAEQQQRVDTNPRSSRSRAGSKERSSNSMALRDGSNMQVDSSYSRMESQQHGADSSVRSVPLPLSVRGVVEQAALSGRGSVSGQGGGGEGSGDFERVDSVLVNDGKAPSMLQYNSYNAAIANLGSNAHSRGSSPLHYHPDAGQSVVGSVHAGGTAYPHMQLSSPVASMRRQPQSVYVTASASAGAPLPHPRMPALHLVNPASLSQDAAAYGAGTSQQTRSAAPGSYSSLLLQGRKAPHTMSASGVAWPMQLTAQQAGQRSSFQQDPRIPQQAWASQQLTPSQWSTLQSLSASVSMATPAVRLQAPQPMPGPAPPQRWGHSRAATNSGLSPVDSYGSGVLAPGSPINAPAVAATEQTLMQQHYLNQQMAAFAAAAKPGDVNRSVSMPRHTNMGSVGGSVNMSMNWAAQGVSDRGASAGLSGRSDSNRGPSRPGTAGSLAHAPQWA